MALRTKFVRNGGWRTLESFWGASGNGFFHNPAGASIRVRYGGNSWWNGFTRQQKKLTGDNAFKLSVGSYSSVARARMQMSVRQDQDVTYHIFPGGVVSTPGIPF